MFCCIARRCIFFYTTGARALALDGEGVILLDKHQNMDIYWT
jgi:hypothetical protein